MKPLQRNNFPREGLHNTVTGEEVRRLEENRPTLNTTVEYTIGGTVEGVVHTSVEADREYTINRGHRILHQASQIMRTAAAHAARGHNGHHSDMNAIKQRAQERRDRQAHGVVQDQGHDH